MSTFVVFAFVLFAAANGQEKLREKKGLFGLGYGGSAAGALGGSYGAYGDYGANVNYDALAALYGSSNVGYGAFGVHGLGGSGHGGFGYGGFGAGGFGAGGFGAGALVGSGNAAGFGGFGGHRHGW